MCGPYIHGRSWLEDGIWKHFCKPFRVNSHNEMPLSERRQVGERIIQDGRGLSVGSRIETKMFWEEYIQLHYPNNSSSDRFELDQESHPELGVIVQKLYKIGGGILDWGITPWDGKLVFQRGDEAEWLVSGVVLDIIDQNYLPSARNDLTKWARNHWGKRNDDTEFLREMPKCLDGKIIGPKLSFRPSKLSETAKRQILVKIGDKVIGNASDIVLTTKDEIDLAISNSLVSASDPCERWCEMFKEAPNEFWAGRN